MFYGLWNKLDNQSTQTLVLEASNPGHVHGPLICVFCIIYQMLNMQNPSDLCVLVEGVVKSGGDLG